MLSREEGQNLVLVALAMVGMIGMLALVIDGGLLLTRHRHMQNAADAAVLAAVRELALESDDATIAGRLEEYVAMYDATADVEARYLPGNELVGAGSVPELATGIAVTTTTEMPALFSGIAHILTMTAHGSAWAAFGPAAAVSDARPIAVQDFPFEYGRTYTIWDDESIPGDPATGTIAGSLRGWLNFNGADVGNEELKEWMQHGYPGTVTQDTWVNGDPGSRSSVVQEAVNLIGETVLVALYDTTRPGTMGNGSLDYHIVSFAAFEIHDVQTTGNWKRIIGVFRHFVTAGAWGGNVDRGVRVVRITR